jgi:restriction system protein
MPILNHEQYMSSILRILNESGPLHRKDLIEAVGDAFELPQEERIKENENGTVLFRSRIHWASQYLYMAGCLQRPSRGVYEITERGLELLQRKPTGVNKLDLEEFEEMRAWTARSRGSQKERRIDPPEQIAQEFDSGDPEEQMAKVEKEINLATKNELLGRILQLEPERFEKLVLKLLHRLGYGASEEDLDHSGQSGDEGIDGIINQDHLGLQNLYIQAKRYAVGNPVGSPDIRNFLGSLVGKGANSGVFITTSVFTKDALQFADEQKSPRIILIDGYQLVELMTKTEFGVIVKNTYKVYSVDENFFDDDSDF